MSFTQNWSNDLSVFLTNLKDDFSARKMTCLEIGSFEGRGSLLIHDKLCAHPESKLFCMDPWEDKYVADCKVDTSSMDGFFVGQFERFTNNTKHLLKIVPMRGYSQELIQLLPDESLDFVFIDGDHFAAGRDFRLVWPKMKLGSLIVFDDYDWEFNGDRPVKRDANMVLTDYQEQVSVLVNKGILALKKNHRGQIVFDVYALNWNEQLLLPFFFKHYAQARNIYILDNMSSDDSRKIIEEHGGIVIDMDSKDKLDDTTFTELKNQEWKKYSKDCDFVIVQDLDEFLHFCDSPGDLLTGMKKLRDEDVTIVKCKAYHMFSHEPILTLYSQAHRNLISLCHNGSDEYDKCQYDKCILFNPQAIIDINYAAGGHLHKAQGRIKLLESESVLLLHYKYLGMEYCLTRAKMMRDRLSEKNKIQGMGFQYMKSDSEMNEFISELFDKYASLSLFDKLFCTSHIAQLKFNKQTCLVDTYGKTDVVSDSLLCDKIWEPRIAQFIKQVVTPGLTTFVDIGANIGTHTCVAKLLGCKDVYAIECNRETFAKLRNTVRMNGFENVHLFEFAASDTNEANFEFNTVPSNLGASHIIKTHIGWNGVTNKAPYTVKAMRIDSILPTSQINFAVVKMDIEGHELEAIQGMQNLLAKTSILIIEINPSACSIPRLIAVIDELFQHFKTCVVLFDILTDDWCGQEINEEVTYPHITREKLIEMLDRNNIVEVAFQK